MADNDLKRLRAAFKEGCFRYALPENIPSDEDVDRGVAALLREMRELGPPALQAVGRPKPTIAELENILKSESEDTVEILPSGELVCRSMRVEDWNASLDAILEQAPADVGSG